MIAKNYLPKKNEFQTYRKWKELKLGKTETQQKIQPIYLILDLNGVIVDNTTAMLSSLEKLGFFEDSKADFSQVVKNFNLSYFPTKSPDLNQEIKLNFLEKVFANALTEKPLTKTEITEKTNLLDQISNLNLDFGINIFDGFVDLIHTIPNLKLALNTSANQRFLDKVLPKINLKFDLILSLEDGLSKQAKFEKIIKFWSIKKEKVWFITDTISDFLEAKEVLNLDKILLSSWGWSSYQFLRQSQIPTKQILINFDDLNYKIQTAKKNHCILMPPPNLTGNLHAGHAFQHFLMDSLCRIQRQNGNLNLWQPGVDHAGIQLEGVIDKLIKRMEI